MPLERLIDLLAEAAVRKLSQEREKQEADADETLSSYKRFPLPPRHLLNHFKHLLARCGLGTYHRNTDQADALSPSHRQELTP